MDSPDLPHKKNARLNMKHGFIHHIRRNQIKRDEYDKEFEANKVLNAENRSKRREKRPEKEVYKTPIRKESNQNMVKNDEKIMFILDYRDNDKKQHKITVHQNDHADKIANDLAKTASIPDELLETLKWKIKQEIMKRKNVN